MRDVVADSLRALEAANDPQNLFGRSGQMVYVGVDERSRPSIIEINKNTKPIFVADLTARLIIIGPEKTRMYLSRRPLRLLMTF